jgi:ubiquinone/menaquinone biosynthesis C-methylase UbiE
MLELAATKLRTCGLNVWVAAGDHRRLPLKSRRVDLIVSGWSVSYVTVWNAGGWREAAQQWFEEARRVLRKGGHIILLESLGTGNDVPVRLPHLENFYRWLDETGFSNDWIRTDYRFESLQTAEKLAGFFFGEDIKRLIKRQETITLAECTGVWWKQI